MHHRIDLRFPLVLPVAILNYVDCSDYRIFQGKTRNISFTGMFVDLFGLRVPDKSYIYTRITGKAHEMINIGGLVVRQNNLGIGVLFDDYTSDVGQQIGKILSLHFNDERQPSMPLHDPFNTQISD